MTTALLLQAATPVPASPDQSENAVQLRALAEHQATTTVQLLNTESQLISYKSVQPSLTGTQRGDIDREIPVLEGRITGMRTDLASTRQRIQELRGAGIAGAPPHSQGFTRMDYEGVAGLLILFPIVLAATRWAWRRGAKALPQSAPIGDARFERLEQAVESIAIEVERISESQRFTTKLLSERQTSAAPERAREPNRLQRPIITPVP